MKKALISPNEFVQYLSSWEKIDDKKYLPIYSVCGVRVAEVANVEFEVAEPLFWVECADDVTAELYYYDGSSRAVLRIPSESPYPTDEEPTPPNEPNAQT
jgi:hypothetical protein